MYFPDRGCVRPLQTCMATPLVSRSPDYANFTALVCGTNHDFQFVCAIVIIFLVISNDNSFRVLFDEIASVYFI